MGSQVDFDFLNWIVVFVEPSTDVCCWFCALVGLGEIDFCLRFRIRCFKHFLHVFTFL